MDKSNFIFGAIGIVISIAGLAYTIKATNDSEFYWKNESPYAHGESHFSLDGNTKETGDADILYVVDQSLSKKNKIISELDFFVQNVSKAPESDISVNFKFIEINGKSPGVKEDISDIMDKTLPIPLSIKRQVTTESKSFDVHFEVERLIPGSSFSANEPICLPNDIYVDTDATTKDNVTANIKLKIKYLYKIPTIVASSTRIIYSGILNIGTIFSEKDSDVDVYLYNYTKRKSKSYLDDRGILSYISSILYGEKRHFYIVKTRLIYQDDASAYLEIDSVTKYEYYLSSWSFLFGLT